MTNLCEQFDLLMFDLDGVVYVGPDAVPHAAEAISASRQAGVGCAFITNNASRTANVVAGHLTDIGVPCGVDEVVTSPQAAVSLLEAFVPPGSRVLVIGGAGIADVLADRGYQPVSSLDDGPAAVVQGFSPDLGWRDLAEATFAVRAGLPWIATNRDLTFPTPRGVAPGNGSLVAMISAIVGRPPDAVAGKPEPPLLEEAIRRSHAKRPLMVGDRLDTDIEAGHRLGLPTLLVMTGVTTPEEVLRASPHERPQFIGRDLRVLNQPYAPAAVDPSGTRAQCAEAQVELEGSVLSMVGSGADPVHLLRAAAALAWMRADAGADPGDLHAADVVSAWQGA